MAGWIKLNPNNLRTGGDGFTDGNTLTHYGDPQTMLRAVKIALEAAGLRDIHEVNWHDPTLTLLGDGWSLAITCPWQVTDGQSRMFGWDDPEVGNYAPRLLHRTITDVRQRSIDAPSDPAFVLSGGLVLEIAADSDLDPWVLILPTEVFVGFGPSSNTQRDIN